MADKESKGIFSFFKKDDDDYVERRNNKGAKRDHK